MTKRIDQLPAATEAQGSDLLIADQDKGGGVLETRKLTVDQVYQRTQSLADARYLKLSDIQSDEGDTEYPMSQAAVTQALAGKLDASALTSNLTYFFTTKASGISGYNKLVTDTHDPDFDAAETVIESGFIGGEDVSIGSFVTTEGVKAVHLDNLTMTISGAVRRASPDSANVAVKFEVWVRQLDSTEYKIGESGYSVNLQPVFHDLHLSAIIPHVEFELGDRLVIKHFARRIGQGANPKVRYRVGGDDPMRALLPMPIDVIVHGYAKLSGGAAADFELMPRVDGSPIVERGSNASGEYIMFADGTLIVTLGINLDLNSRETQDFPLPASMIDDVNSCAVSWGMVPAGVGYASWQNALSHTSSFCAEDKLRLRVTQNRVEKELPLIAVATGRWK